MCDKGEAQEDGKGFLDHERQDRVTGFNVWVLLLSLRVNIQFHISSLIKSHCKNLEEIRGLLFEILANELLELAIGHSMVSTGHIAIQMMPCFEFIIHLVLKGGAVRQFQSRPYLLNNTSFLLLSLPRQITHK